MGSPVKAYTFLAGFAELVLEESFVLGIRVEPSRATFEVEFVLTPDHPAYTPALSGERECFRQGWIRFFGVQRLLWENQGRRPAIDATGTVDYGHIDSFASNGDIFRLDGDWGTMELTADRVEVDLGK